MKFFIKSPSIDGFIDPPVHSLLNKLFKPVEKAADCDIFVIPITKHHFKFNEKLYNLNKPYILVCFSEYGWNWDQQSTHIWGKNTFSFNDWFVSGPSGTTEEWEKFEDFIKNKPPLITFKRELLKKDVSNTLRPIEYLALHSIPETQSYDEFHARRIEVLFSWGKSHESRCRFHGDIFVGSTEYDYDVVSNWNHIDKQLSISKRKLWVAVHVPHYDRSDMKMVMKFNGMAKISASFPGAGVKCFRSLESPLNSIVALPYDNLAWSYPWISRVNCFRLNSGIGASSISPEMRGSEIKQLHSFLKDETSKDLYEIYLSGVENARRYTVSNYLNNYIIPSIENV